MSNTPVWAAAEGMPAINRRRLLMGLAAASTTAAAVTVATSVQAEENAELLRLGNQLPAVEAEYYEARAAVAAIVREWSPRWPSTPAALFGEGDARDCNLTGRSFMLPPDKWGKSHPRTIATVENLQWRIDMARTTVKGKKIDKRRFLGLDRAGWEQRLAEELRLEAIAARHEAKCKRIRDASGYRPAKEREKAAREALADLICAIMAQPETSMDGIMVKAQALAAWGKTPAFEQMFSVVKAYEWGPQLATSVVRLAGQGTSV